MTDRTAYRVLYVGLACILLGQASAFLRIDHDMLHAMAHVRQSIERGSLRGGDLFAFTPTINPMVHHEWGSGALLYFVCVVCGLGGAGLVALKYLVVAGIGAGCFRSAARRGAHPLIFAMACPVGLMLVSFGLTTIRAQLFTLCFTSLLLWMLAEDWLGNRRWLFAWLPLFLVWVNLHGGFLAAVGLYGLHCMERGLRVWCERKSLSAALFETRHLALGLAGMFALTFVNPFGPGFAWEVVQAAGMKRPLISEWARLWDIPLPHVMLPMFGAAVIIALYSLTKKGLLALPDLTLAIITGVMAVLHIRHLPIFAVVWMCLAPAWLTGTELGDLLTARLNARPRLVAAIGVLLAVIGLTHAVRNRFWEPTLPTSARHGQLAYPAGVVDYLAAHKFRGNLMNTFMSGSYVSWRLYPNVKVSIDSRYEAAFPPAVAEELMQLHDGREGWQQTLERYPADAILTLHTSPLDQEIPKLTTNGQPTWKRVYHDDAYSLYLRADQAKDYPVEDRSGQVIEGRFP